MPGALRKYFIFSSLLLYVQTVHCQDNQDYKALKYPIRFGQYYNCISLVNPSSSGWGSNFETALGHKRVTGKLNVYSTYFANANMRLRTFKQHNQSPFSVIGILLYNDAEGSYLNRTRFYATYAWHSYISRNVSFSGGFHIGGMNYSVKKTSTNPGKSDMAPDGTIGFSVYNKKFHFGAALNQVFQSKIKPWDETTLLSRFYNITGSYKYALNSEIVFHPTAFLTIRSHTNSNYPEYIIYDINALFTYKDILGGMAGIKDRNNIICAFELKNIILNNLKLYISYSFPTKKVSGIRQNVAELGIYYNFDSFQE